jgi:hypothetical protein
VVGRAHTCGQVNTDTNDPAGGRERCWRDAEVDAEYSTRALGFCRLPEEETWQDRWLATLTDPMLGQCVPVPVDELLLL